jgi:peptide chain release factor 1
VLSTGARPKADLRGRLLAALERADAVEKELSDPATTRDPAKLAGLGREHARLEPIVRSGRRLLRVWDDLAAARELAEGDDQDLAALARAEIDALQPEQARLEDELAEALTPRDPLDDRDAIVEIRGGTGGDEAGLFAADLLRMYTRYAERRGHKVEMISLSSGNVGALRSEAGVHRVQRVPATEGSGRIHTSAATVAVLPEAEEVDVAIPDKDIRVDVMRSGGPGGQSVNTTDSAVRITHLPTGLVVKCQDQKSQLQNRIKAMEVLRSRLLDKMIADQEAARAHDRRAMVGTGDRSAKIRTYNFPQSRVTDHRIGLSVHNLADVLDGDLDEIVKALRQQRTQELE